MLPDSTIVLPLLPVLPRSELQGISLGAPDNINLRFEISGTSSKQFVSL